MMNQLSLSVAHSGRMLFSFISCFILSIHLSLGLPLGRDPGTWVARTYFAILCSSLLWTWPNQDNRFFVRKVFIACTWAFSRMVVFLIWSFLVFPCIHLNIFIYVVFIRLWSLFRIGQHSPPYVIAGLIAVLYMLFFNASGTFLSQMTPDISRHLFQPDWILLVTSFSHPPSACKVEPKYLKESTTGSRSPNRNISSWQFRDLRYSVFFLFIFRPFSSNTLLHFSNSSSTSVLDSAHIARSSANSSPHGGRVPTSDANTSITMMNSKGLKADPWCKPTSISKYSVFTAMSEIVHTTI